MVTGFFTISTGIILFYFLFKIKKKIITTITPVDNVYKKTDFYLFIELLYTIISLSTNIVIIKILFIT